MDKLKTNYADGEILYAQDVNKITSAINANSDKMDAIHEIVRQNELVNKEHEYRLDYLRLKVEGQSWNWQEQSVDGTYTTVPKGAYAGHITSLGGRSIIWNQMQNAEIQSLGGITATKSADGYYYTFSGTCTSPSQICTKTVNGIAGHKYLAKYTFTNCPSFTDQFNMFQVLDMQTNASIVLATGTQVSVKKSGSFYAIYTATVTTSNIMTRIRIQTGVNYTGLIIYKPMWFDLTQMFGAGNEPTAEEFEAMFPEPYYPYCVPTVVSASVDKVVSKGVNLLDPTLHEFGFYNATGAWRNDSNILGTKELMPIKPNTRYYCRGVNGVNLYVTLWDSNRNFITRITTSTTAFLTTPDNARYFAYNLGQACGNVWHNDMYFGVNSDFVPCFKIEMSIPDSVIALDGYGLGVNGVYNELDIENGVFIKRVTIDGTTITELAEPVITPLSELISADDLATLRKPFDTESEGTITFHTSGEVQVPTRATLEYAVKVDEAI